MTDTYKVEGFTASAVASGVKKNGRTDLALIYSTVPASVAGVYTRNRVQAAPVLLSRERAAGGRCRAVVVNSGCANCCTGPEGLADARRVTGDVARALGVEEDLVMAASTGVIGQPLKVDRIQAAIPNLIRELRPEGFDDFSRAILTTDTVAKIEVVCGAAGGKPYHILATAKGAGMIRPDMATMLCFVCTDAQADPSMLQECLGHAVDASFNRITIDGDTSTNDTVLLLANGASGAVLADPAAKSAFQELLGELLMSIARKLVADGEGVTKVVEIRVQGAETFDDAKRIADTVAHSPLFKTALFGEDANWGRILAAAGRAGAALDPDRVDVFFDDVQMVRNGRGCGDEFEARVTEIMRGRSFGITVDLHLGEGTASMLTCDFSIDYVKINADYRS